MRIIPLLTTIAILLPACVPELNDDVAMSQQSLSNENEILEFVEENAETGLYKKTFAKQTSDGLLEVEPSAEEVNALRASQDEQQAPSAERRVVFIMVNLQDALISDPIAKHDEIIDSMYTGVSDNGEPAHVNENYELSSYGQMSFDGDIDKDGEYDVFGPFDVTQSRDSCAYFSWATAANAEAEAAGVDLSLYQHIVYVHQNVDCGWAGIAQTICTSTCRAWLNATHQNIIAHELGHNLNLGHSSKDVNGDGIIAGSLEVYGDTYTMMAIGLGQMNAPHRDKIGWFDAFPNSVQEVENKGTYTIRDLNEIGTGPQALTINVGDDRTLYVSYRKPDLSHFGAHPSISDRIRVHECKNNSCITTSLVANLSTGESYEDPSGVRITALTGQGNSASADIEFLACDDLPLEVNLAPSPLVVRPRALLEYEITVTNNDRISCDPATVDLSASLFSIPFQDIENIGLTPQETYRFNISRTTPDFLEGEFEQIFRVSKNQAPPVELSATIRIDATVPTAPRNLIVSSVQDDLVLRWDASDDGGYPVTYRVIFNDRSERTEQTSWTLLESGTYTVVAVDQVQNQSAASEPLSFSFDDNDGDLVIDVLDNCINTYNPNQIDADCDGFGNYCDADFNGDQITNFIDYGYMRENFLSTNPIADLDTSGSVNFLDIAIFQTMFLEAPGPRGHSASICE